MRKFLVSFFFAVAALALMLVLKASMPRYSGTLIFFFVFLLFDVYLWFSVRVAVRPLGFGVQALTAILFWLPVVLLLWMTLYGFVVPYVEWNIPLRTYLQNFLLILFLTEIFPITALVLADLIRAVKYTVRLVAKGNRIYPDPVRRLRPVLFTGWLLGGLVFISMTAGTVFWQFDFRVRQHEITLKQLPPAFDGFRIVQFSDVHLGSWGVKQKLQEAMAQINSLKPDVIFFTGDMFNYCTADGAGFENILKTLHAPAGVYAIPGNHDYGDYISWPDQDAKRKNMADMESFYRYLGWKLLRNSNDILHRGSDSIAVIGVENWGATRRFQRFGDVALAQKGTESMPVQLLLSHDPSHWDSIVSKQYKNIDITFSGHTHGGQVGIDCCNIHWSPVSWVSKYWCGLYENNDPGEPQYLYVNQALGNIGYAGRIGIMPEITVVTLKHK